MSIQIIYYSRYGSTGEIAQTIGKKLGTDTISDIKNLKEINEDLIIVGSAIFTEVPDEEILNLLKNEGGKLKDKKVAIFVVCLRKKYIKASDREGGGPVYIDEMEKALGRTPLTGKIFGGRMIIAELEGKDLKRTEEFSKKPGMPFKDVNVMAESEVNEFIQDIKTKIDL